MEIFTLIKNWVNTTIDEFNVVLQNHITLYHMTVFEKLSKVELELPAPFEEELEGIALGELLSESILDNVSGLRQLYHDVFSELKQSCVLGKMAEETVNPDTTHYNDLIEAIKSCLNEITDFASGEYSEFGYLPSPCVIKENNLSFIDGYLDTHRMTLERQQFTLYREQYYHLVKAISKCRDILIKIKEIELLLELIPMYED